MKRRAFCGSTIVLLSGCVGVLSRPDPVVTDLDYSVGLSALEGKAEFYVFVENRGAAGDVMVEIRFHDKHDTIIASRRKTVHIEADQRRRVTFTLMPPLDTETFTAVSKPA